ncbi:unnamed protein product, partial [marine sediment metagenome]
MKTEIIILILSILLITSVSGMVICVDKDPPSLMNSSLTLTATNNNINLNW